MLRTPIESIILLPLALEGFAISGIRPELRLFQENVADTGINHGLNLRFLEILQIVQGRNDIRYSGAMHNRITLHTFLSLIHVRLSVPFAGEVISISTPGNTCHEMSDIPFLTPSLHSFTERKPRTTACAIHHHGIGPHIRKWFPLSRSLESCLYILGVCHQTATHHP